MKNYIGVFAVALLVISLFTIVSQPVYAEGGEDMSTLRVSGIFVKGDEAQTALTYHGTTTTSPWLKIGDRYRDMEVLEIDDEKEEVLLKADDMMVTVYLESDPDIVRGVEFGTSDGSIKRLVQTNDSVIPVDESFFEAEPKKYQPGEFLPMEVEKGIDPNDPTTWPPDYRGPGIERMIKDHESVLPVLAPPEAIK